jgi:hypothetical protein
VFASELFYDAQFAETAIGKYLEAVFGTSVAVPAVLPEEHHVGGDDSLIGFVSSGSVDVPPQASAVGGDRQLTPDSATSSLS